MECAICRKRLSRFYAVRIGGLIEQITGESFMCRECVRRVHSGEVKVEEMTMEKLNTIQKRNKLNEVYRTGEIGPGGAYHEYKIETIRPYRIPGIGTSRSLGTICFQNGPRNVEGSTHGVLDVDLLEIVRDRLTCFQAGDYACRENAIALTHIEDALLWLNKRVEDRAERGVLGKNEA